MGGIKAVVFDFWDTLCPATIDFVHLRSLTKKSGMEMKEFIARYEEAVQEKEYSSFEELREDFFREFGGDEMILEQELYEIFFNRFDKYSFFPKAEETLSELKAKGFKLGLLSNMESLVVGRIEEKLRLSKRFDAIVYSFEVGEVKPSPKMFQTVLEKLGVDAGEALMVGDSLRSDIAGAQKVGMQTCFVDRKKKAPEKGVDPDYAVGTIDKVLEVVGERE